MSRPWRRRLDGLILRWQARLDSEWADRVVPWATFVGLFIVLWLLALAKARSLEGTPDLAAYQQAAWLLGEHQIPVTTVTTGQHVLAQQAAVAFYPVGWLTILLPTIPALLAVQSAALAIGTVPLWRIARKVANLRTGAAATLLVAYALYPVLHNLNLDGFHPETIALPALLGAILFGLTGRYRLLAVCCIIAMATRADLGLAVAGLGGLLIVEKRRRAGTIALVAGLAWTLLAVTVIQPWYGDGSFAHLASFAQFGDTPLSVAWGMLTHPVDVLGRITSEQNFQLFVVLFAPVFFLPILAPRYLVPVLPLQFLYLVAAVPREAVFGQQTVAITAFIFLATAMALARIGRRGHDRVTVDRRVLGALLLASSVFFIRDAAASPYRSPWDWGGQDVVDAARLRATDRIAADASVRASPSMYTLLAERPRLYPLVPTERPDPAAVAQGVDAVVLDVRQVGAWRAEDWRSFRQGLEDRGFAQTADEQGIQLFQRR